MKLKLDTEGRTLAVENGEWQTHDLYSLGAFEQLSRQWVRVGWSLRYFSGFTWMGLPVLQLPDDLVRFQEVFWEVRPTLVIETGVYRGGSLLFHASLCKATGAGRVIGVDVNVPSSLREAISDHMLGSHITLVEGDSASADVLEQVSGLRKSDDTTLVLLDSDHSRRHVRNELEAYAPLVTPGSYLIVADTIVRDLADVPGGQAAWVEDNPASAVGDFLKAHPEFERSPRSPQTGVENLPEPVSYWPGGWLRRRKT